MASLKDLMVLGPARFLDNIYGNLKGNADTASKWKTSRNLSLAQDASGSVAVDGSSNVTLNVTNNKMKGYEFISGVSPQVWYKSKVTYTNTTIPTDVWYVKITISATWVYYLTPLLIEANYSNHSGILTLNLDALPPKWMGYLTDYSGSNIKAIRRVQNNDSKKTEIYVKLAKPTEYNGSTPLGSITVYSPYNIDSIVTCTAAEAGELIDLRNGYNSNTPITTSDQIYGNADTADKWKTARTLTIGYKGQSVKGDANVTWSLHDILYSSSIGTATSWDIINPGVYYVSSNSAFTGSGNPESANGGTVPYRYGQLIVSRASNGGVAQFYVSHADSNTSTSYGIKFRTGWANSYNATWRTLMDSTNYTNWCDSRYVNTAGDTMTGALNLVAEKHSYHSDANSYALNLNNSDIIKVNSVYFADACEGMSEGIHFYRSATTWDGISANSGVFYFASNHTGSTGLTGNAQIRAGEYISNGANAFRMIQGNYGSFWRNDGSNTYLLLTASGDQYGSWTSARPISVNNSTGICNINGNAATASVATKLGTSTVGSSTKPIYLNAGSPTAFSSTIGDSQTPVYLNSGSITAGATYANRPYTYNKGYAYYYTFGGAQDLNWKKVFAASHTATAPTTDTYIGCTVKGIIYHYKGNYNQAEVDEYPFQMNMVFLSGTSVSNSCTLRVAAGCPDTIIRAVRVATNSFELQVRQPADWQKITIQFSLSGSATNMSVFDPVNSSNSTVIAFSRLTTSKYISDAYNGTTTTFAYSQAGLSTTSWFAAWNGYELRGISPTNSRITMSALSATNANGYYGMGRPDGNTTDWIRTTSNGIIPYKSGGASALGTSSWPFSNAYINTVYGSLEGGTISSTSEISMPGEAGKSILSKSYLYLESAASDSYSDFTIACRGSHVELWFGDESYGDWFSVSSTSGGQLARNGTQIYYNQGNIIYSSTEPTAPHVGAIWLKPI